MKSVIHGIMKGIDILFIIFLKIPLHIICDLLTFGYAKRCEECGYLKMVESTEEKKAMKCTASCGNDEGRVCSAWYPKWLME